MRKSKGVSIIELVVSIALLSLVMIFAFGILTEVKDEEISSNASSRDVLNRSYIISNIQDDLILNGLNKITECSEGILCVIIDFDKGPNKKIVITDDSFRYDDEKWMLETGSYSFGKDTRYCYDYEVTGDRYSLLVKFYVNLIGHLADGERMFDIELFSIGDVSEVSLLPNSSPSLSKSTPLCDDYIDALREKFEIENK